MYKEVYLSLVLLWAGYLGWLQLPVCAQTPIPSTSSPAVPKVITVKTGEILRVKVNSLLLGQPIAVFLGDTDITAQIKIEGQELVYQSDLLPLPVGEQLLTVYLTQSTDRWETLATFQLKVESAVAQSPQQTEASPSKPGEPGSSSTEPPSPPPESSPEGVFVVKPKFTANLKSQFLEKRTPDAGASKRPSVLDLGFTGGVSSQYQNGATKFKGNFNLVGTSFQPEALRFKQLQGNASQIDLSEYLLDFSDGGNKFALGNVCVGNHPFLFNKLCTRGFSGTVSLTSFADFNIGSASSTEIVGFENITGVGQSQNTLSWSTLGLQLMKNAADGVRLETTIFDAARLPEASFNVGEVVDAEQSNGVGWRLTAGDDTGRWKADAGFARSTFANVAANDPQLTGGLNVVPLQSVTKNAWYAETSYDILKDFKLDGTRNLSLAANLRLEQIDPQFGTVGAKVDADRLQAQYGLNARIGDATVQFQQTNFEDNIVNIPNLLKTRNKSTTIGLNLPLQSLLQVNNPLIPTISYNYQQTGQLGSIAAALNGGFNQTSQIPDQFNAKHEVGLSWATPDVILNYKFTNAFEDNRQLGRENADFRNINHQISVDVKPSPQLRLNLGYNFTNVQNFERQLNRLTNSPTLGLNWEFRPDWTLAFSYNRNSDVDTLGESSTNSNIIDLLLTWSFKSNFLGRDNPGSVFLRYGRQSTLNRSGLINTDNTVDIINSGISWSF
jgi:hypothetical protein